MPVTITDVVARDIRFPTSENLDGSDAMNRAPDYSAAYVILQTDTDLEGHGLTFTIARQRVRAASGWARHNLEDSSYVQP